MGLKKFVLTLKNKFGQLFNNHTASASTETAFLLNNTQLFNKLQKKEFLKLCSKVKYRYYVPGEVILKEGDLGDAFYVIQKGAVRVYTYNQEGEEIVLARLQEGDYFGEQSLLDETPGKRNASIRAITKVCVLILEEKTVKPFLMREKVRAHLETEGAKQLLKKIIHQTPPLAISKMDSNLLVNSKISHFSNDQIIFSQGDQPDNVYFILSGLVEVQLKYPTGTTVQANVETGQLLGEVGVIKNQPRAGTAIAKGPVKTLAIPANLFDKLRQYIPELKKLIGTLQQIYQIPQHGFVTLSCHTQLGKEIINANLRLANDRIIIASRMQDQEIFTMTCPGISATQRIYYERDNEYREITLHNDRLIGIFCFGTWAQLAEICGLLINETAITAKQIARFQQQGNLLSIDLAKTTEPNQLICYCMQTRRYQIENAIRAGYVTTEDIMDVLGTGSVCAACRPQIQHIIGNPKWFNVTISHVIYVTPDVRVYRLKGLAPLSRDYEPGQYINMAALINDNWIERPYTLTSVGIKHDYLEVAIKREPRGYFSNWLFNHDKDDPILKVSPPLGNFVFNIMQKAPLVFFAGGIGVTPALAYARSMSVGDQQRRLHLDFSARNEEGLLFAEEFLELMQQHQDLTVNFRNTSKMGQLTPVSIKRIVAQFPDAEFFICGPERFLEGVKAALKECQVNEAKIKVEEYTAIGGPLKV